MARPIGRCSTTARISRKAAWGIAFHQSRKATRTAAVVDLRRRHLDVVAQTSSSRATVRSTASTQSGCDRFPSRSVVMKATRSDGGSTSAWCR